MTNRNEPLPAGDTIAIFAPYSQHPSSGAESRLEGKFRYLGSVATGLQHLRSISLGGPEARYVLAGGVNGGGVKVFERDGYSLREVASVPIEKPTHFVWL